MEPIYTEFLNSARSEFERYRKLGEAAMAQLSDRELYLQPGPADNSVAVIVNHLAGNMLSRWTNFLAEDGEKPWRNREAEFGTPPATREKLTAHWQAGWDCLFAALETLGGADPGAKVMIRNQPHSIAQAVQRQLAHYASHVGQMVYLAKMLKGPNWEYLSIAPGQSEAFNRELFGPGSQST